MISIPTIKSQDGAGFSQWKAGDARERGLSTDCVGLSVVHRGGFGICPVTKSE
jgi:hypothetical protein